MKLWIDDLRPPPDRGWEWVKTSADALLYLKHFAGEIAEISFDHDLGGEDTSMRVAHQIEARAYHGRIDPIIWHIHSANPVGRKNLAAALTNADRYWAEPPKERG